jgi:hypothetical protein
MTCAQLQVVVTMIEIRAGPRAGDRQAGGEHQCAGKGREGERFHIRIVFGFVCRSEFVIEETDMHCDGRLIALFKRSKNIFQRWQKLPPRADAQKYGLPVLPPQDQSDSHNRTTPP